MPGIYVLLCHDNMQAAFKAFHLMAILICQRETNLKVALVTFAKKYALFPLYIVNWPATTH